MANEKPPDVRNILRLLSETSKQEVKDCMIKCDDQLLWIQGWKLTAMASLQCSDRVVEKKKMDSKTALKPAKCKIGRSVSFPCKKTCHKKISANLKQKLKAFPVMCSTTTPRIPNKLRSTRSFPWRNRQSIQISTKSELLNMHAELTQKCKFDRLPTLHEQVKRKSCEELLKMNGVMNKRLSGRLSSDNAEHLIFNATSTGQEAIIQHCNTVGNEICIPNKVKSKVDELPKDCKTLIDTCGVKAKVFNELASSSDMNLPILNVEDADKPEYLSNNLQEADLLAKDSNSYLASSSTEPTPLLINSTFIVADQNPVNVTVNLTNKSDEFKSISRKGSEVLFDDQVAECKVTPNALKDENSTTQQIIGPTSSDTCIIKKKNLTSLLYNKSSVLTSKNTPTTATKSDKSEDESAGGMKLRSRTKPVVCAKKPVTRKTTRQTKTQNSADEIEDKLKRREECIKQQKLDLQLKAEERKQRREERMRKTKEARDKIEKDRLQKVQSSDEKKRQRVDSVRETQAKKKLRTRQDTKKEENAPKKTTSSAKSTKRKRQNNLTATSNLKSKEENLTAINEAESESEDSGLAPGKLMDEAPNKKKLFNGELTFTQPINSTFTLKNIAPNACQNLKQNVKQSAVPDSVASCKTPSQQLSSATVVGKTFLAEKSPLLMKENQSGQFKKPTGTPLPGGKNTPRNTDPSSKKQSSEANYEMTPYRDDDEEDSMDEDDPEKPKPSWACGTALKAAIIKQAFHPPDLDKLFGRLPRTVDLIDIFGKTSHRCKKYNKRTSSAVWRNISFNIET